MPPVVHPSKSDSNELVSVTVPVMIIMWSQQSIHQPKNIRMTYAKGSSVVRKQMCKTTLKLMLQNGIRADVAMCSTATRTCAYAREARASGATRSSVGLHRRGRALLGHRVKRPAILQSSVGHPWHIPESQMSFVVCVSKSSQLRVS